MPNSLEDKIAVVTGVSHQGQIGETVAKALADRGAALAICARTERSAAMKPKDLKHWTKRDDIAETVVFLASPAGAGITGQVVAVTGWEL